MDLKDIVLKIASKQASPKMGLGNAFNDIMAPIQAIDAPVNRLIESGAEKFANLTDLKKGATGQPDEVYQPIARAAFDGFTSAVAPTPSSILLGGASKVLPIMKAVKPSEVAAGMREAKSAAQLFSEAKAAAKSKFGTVIAIPDSVPLPGKVTVKP